MDRMATGQAPLRRNSPQFATDAASGRSGPSGVPWHQRTKENAPGRWRLRPAFRL